MDNFLDLMIMLQDFRLLLDRAYCVELDPEQEYKSLPQFEFHDTWCLCRSTRTSRASDCLGNCGIPGTRDVDRRCG